MDNFQISSNAELTKELANERLVHAFSKSGCKYIAIADYRKVDGDIYYQPSNILSLLNKWVRDAQAKGAIAEVFSE